MSADRSINVWLSTLLNQQGGFVRGRRRGLGDCLVGRLLKEAHLPNEYEAEQNYRQQDGTPVWR
jgi:hypothetical protein